MRILSSQQFLNSLFISHPLHVSAHLKIVCEDGTLIPLVYTCNRMQNPKI
jgi:hypothetical protein